MKFLKNFLIMVSVIVVAQSNSADGAYVNEYVQSLIPGGQQGISDVFNVVDSGFLDISINSSETVHMRIESVPNMIVMDIEASPYTESTEITINNLLPLTKYYKYEDSHRDLEIITTDENGLYFYVQDLKSPHLVFIKTLPSTKYIKDDSTGGDCELI
ncbi:MAG TPA: hypothetical protein VI432_02410, partial [Candidatus Paceibacterota bacterium]